MSDFESHETFLPDGRRIACWLNRSPQTPSKGSAILAPGFGKRMHQHSQLVHYLVLNGFDVLRFDSVNHVGLSDGEIESFTPSDCLASLVAAASLAKALLPQPITLVATSITARIALRYMASRPAISRLVAISGVVDTSATLSRVNGTDYTAWDEELLPEWVTFESQQIRPQAFYRDIRDNGWLNLDGSLLDVAELRAPVDWFLGSDDMWVHRDEVAACVSANADNHFKLSMLEACGHDIGRNAAVARETMTNIVRLCGMKAGDDAPAVIEPSWDDTLKMALTERRLQRA